MECEYCRGASFTDSEFEVKTQRGQMVRVIFNYCPACGRDLRKRSLMELASKEMICSAINNIKLEDVHDNPMALYRMVLRIVDEMPSVTANESEQTELLSKISISESRCLT